MLKFKNIDKDNWLESIKLTSSLSQEEKEYIAPNVYSIAQAQFYPKAISKAIYNEEDKMVGYTMYGESDDDSKLFFIDRLMISGDYRKHGYGRESLEMIINIAKEEGYKLLGTSTDLKNIKMQKLLEDLSFFTKNEIDDGEIIYYKDIK